MKKVKVKASDIINAYNKYNTRYLHQPPQEQYQKERERTQLQQQQYSVNRNKIKELIINGLKDVVNDTFKQ